VRSDRSASGRRGLSVVGARRPYSREGGSTSATCERRQDQVHVRRTGVGQLRGGRRSVYRIGSSPARHLAAIEHLSPDADSLGRQLHDAVMKPLRDALGSVRDLWLSPDGALSGLPWAALIDENGRPVVESYRLTYLTSGRDLLRLSDSEQANGPAIVMGSPAYDGARQSKPGLRLASEATVETSTRPRAAEKLRFQPLPGTATRPAGLRSYGPGLPPSWARGRQKAC
jgi:hypothetical protein